LTLAARCRQLARVADDVAQRLTTAKRPPRDDERDALEAARAAAERAQDAIALALGHVRPRGLPPFVTIGEASAFAAADDIYAGAFGLPDDVFEGLPDDPSAPTDADLGHPAGRPGRRPGPVDAAADEAEPAEAAAPEEGEQPAATEAATPTPEGLLRALLDEPHPPGSMLRRTIQGTHASLELDTVFQFLSSNRKSGVLRVALPAEQLTFDLIGGDVVFTASDADPPEQRLGAILLRHGGVDAGSLEEFLLTHRPLPEPLGPALEQAGLVSEETLRAALTEQANERFYRAFAAATCAYVFYEGATTPRDERMRMNVAQMLFQSAKTKDETRRAR